MLFMRMKELTVVAQSRRNITLVHVDRASSTRFPHISIFLIQKTTFIYACSLKMQRTVVTLDVYTSVAEAEDKNGEIPTLED